MKSSNQANQLNETKQRPTKSKLRWEIISSALKGQILNNKNPASIRRFSSFGLFDKKEIDDDLESKLEESTEQISEIEQAKKVVKKEEQKDENKKWFYFSLNYKEIKFKIKLKLENPNKIPIKEILHSFDNTGTFLWPGEEVLSYFCLKNHFLFDKLNICELGCGIVGLAGLTIAVSSNPNYVLLTDGNQRCIENVSQIVKENEENFGETKVECRQMKWSLMIENKDKEYENLRNKFDVILCSDCLYFEKSHLPLIETIYSLLNENGICILTAPLRNNTFKEFMKLSCKYFNNIKIHIVYDDYVWQLNRKFQNELSDIYDQSLHYPFMGILSKN